MHGRRPVDEDRLPWLEPYKEAIAPKPRVARRSHGGLVALVAALLLIPVAVGAGFWFGQRSGLQAPPQSTETIALPEARPQTQPVQVAVAPPAEPAPVVEQAAVAAPAKVAKHHRAKKRPIRHHAPRKKIRTAGVETAHINSVRAAQEKQALSRPWPKMPSPGPAGQVIQLGAFTTATRASNAYHSRTARYPLLAGMPKVIVPVVTKPGGRILYVLRLGTGSRQQSNSVCRNLRRSGDHCLVIG
jgi:hypothetical protein